MDNIKSQELSGLYTLRAGLSVISQNSDVYNDKERDCNNYKCNLNYKYKYQSESQVNNDYNDVIRDARDEDGKANMQCEWAEADLKSAKVRLIISVILGIISGFSFVFVIIGFIAKRDIMETNVGLVMMIITSVLGILGGVPALFFLSSSVDNYNDAKKKIEASYRLKSQTREEIEKIESVKQENLAQVKEYEKEKKEYDTLLVTTNKQQSIIQKKCKSIENALIKEFNGLLDIRDWENLDLIIYFYETGRADSIKEALQLVDVERRNNELIKSIQRASNEICSTIQSSVKVLGEVLVAGFNSLSAQLEAQRVQTIGALQQIDQNISDVLNQQTLNNALLTKANVSSKQMVEQLKEINRKVK